MIKPTIHMNGTSAEQLADGYAEAARKLRDAQDALQAINPNGRDYYPQGDGAIAIAIQEQRDRIIKIQEVINDIEALMEHVSDYL